MTDAEAKKHLIDIYLRSIERHKATMFPIEREIDRLLNLKRQAKEKIEVKIVEDECMIEDIKSL